MGKFLSGMFLFVFRENPVLGYAVSGGDEVNTDKLVEPEARIQWSKGRSSLFRHLRRKKRVHNGFTLIELLIVIAVVGGLAGLFITTFPGAQKRGRDTQRKSDVKQYQTAMETYANRTQGNYPNTGGTVNMTSLCATLTLPACPDDPKAANPYRVSSNLTEYVIWARLEQPDVSGNIINFVVCSTGEAGEHISPTGPACPL